MKKKFPFHIIVFLFPACFIYTIFMIFPLFDTLRISFYTQDLMGSNLDNTTGVRTFTGINNYRILFFDELWSYHFWNALKNNTYFRHNCIFSVYFRTPCILDMYTFPLWNVEGRQLHPQFTSYDLVFSVSVKCAGFFNLIYSTQSYVL